MVPDEAVLHKHLTIMCILDCREPKDGNSDMVREKQKKKISQMSLFDTIPLQVQVLFFCFLFVFFLNCTCFSAASFFYNTGDALSTKFASDFGKS